MDASRLPRCCAAAALVVVAALPAVAGEGCPVVSKAVALARQDMIDEAAEYLEKHLGERPGHAECRALLGRIYDYDGRPADAVAVLEKGLTGEAADVNLLWILGQLHARLADDGPTMERKRGHVTCRPSKDEKAEAAFKKEHLVKAKEAFTKGARLRPDIHAFALNLARAQAGLEEYEGAIATLTVLVDAEDDEDECAAECGAELAALYAKVGKEGAAAATYERVLIADPRNVAAHAALSKHYHEAGREEYAEEHRRCARFYGWVPAFIGTPMNDHTYGVFTKLDVAHDEKREDVRERRQKEVGRLLGSDELYDLEFLAALCVRHGDHGTNEEAAFAALEKSERFGVPLLLALLHNGQSACTTRQAAWALARRKATDATETLVDMLPGDARGVWHSNIAEALARLGDARAIPALVSTANVTYEQEESEGIMDSRDGRLSARYRAAVALGAFRGNRTRIEPVLRDGLRNSQMRIACRAGLCRLTGEDAEFEALRSEMLDESGVQSLRVRFAMESTDDERLVALAAEVEAEEKRIEEAAKKAKDAKASGGG